jgi:hypothetical protein
MRLVRHFPASQGLDSPAMMASFVTFHGVVNADGVANDLRAFSWQGELIHALEQTRPGPVVAAGGAIEYVRDGELTDQQIHKNWFGNFAEFVRNRIEGDTSINPDPHDPVTDRFGPNHQTIQDFAGNSPISNFVHNKLENDPADIHRNTDQYYERLQHYHGKFEDIVQSHLHHIVPDSDKIGIHTSTSYWQSMTAHTRDYVQHPMIQGSIDITEHELQAIVIYSAYFLITQAVISGELTLQSFSNLGKLLPSYALRYTALTGFEAVGFEIIIHFAGEQFANLHQDMMVPGLGVVFTSVWNAGKMAHGRMEWYQFQRSFVSSSTTSLTFLVFSCAGSAAATSAGYGTAAGPIGMVAGAVFGGGAGILFALHKSKRDAKFGTDRIMAMIESQKFLYAR